MEDPQLRAQLTALIAAVIAMPAFWEFLKWACSAVLTAITGKKKATTQDIADSVAELRKESEEMRSDIAQIKTKAQEQEEKSEEDKAEANRSDILRFDDELRIGIRHSYEYFDDILKTVKKYEDYCQSHPNFENRKAESAINHIQKAYDKAHEENSFI
jgi:glutamine synthetase type III